MTSRGNPGGAMNTHSFTLVVEGPDFTDEDVANHIYTTLDDVIVRRASGWNLIDVDREADSYGHALFSAMNDLRQVAPDVRIVGVLPEGFLTVQDIVERTGLSRAYVRLLVEGGRGPGQFPAPAVQASGRSRLWRFRDVAVWFAEHLDNTKLLDTLEHKQAVSNGAVNAALALERMWPDLDAVTRRKLASMLPSATPSRTGS